MPRLTESEVLHVANLARLSLDPSEVERFTAQLGAILDHFAALTTLDTTGVEPTSHAVPMTNRFREDEVVPPMPREAIMGNAPDPFEGQYRVPRAIGEDE
jgi:aspartyl-tRNA(Asn)/glutamyl-tRNA(Gln) amidotransferase subunit C